MSQQMASHPQYLESFLRTQHYILHMDGPLPLPYRHYIAIMVSEWAADSANLTSCTLYKSKEPSMLMSEPVVSSCSSICLWIFFPLNFQAAARHHCSYLVYLHSAHFLRVGGDPLWLHGLEAAPPRLRLLDHINKVLAHQPWLTSCSHIQVRQPQHFQCHWNN